nr:pilus assembly protein [Kibdelosporangium sp. MJ126-NF4]
MSTDRGSVTIEASVWLSTIIVLACVLWAYGRTRLADSAVDHVAINTARQASHARTASEAQQVAGETARHVFAEQGLHCVSSSIVVDTAGFSVPVGQPAQVRVHVTCTVELADLSVPAMPGSLTLKQTWSSALDTYRGRS